MTASGSESGRRGWWVVGMLVVLHGATAWPFPWEGIPEWRALRVPTPDGIAIGTCLLLLAIGKVRRTKLFGHALVAMLWLAVAYRVGYTIFPAFYGKPFEPWEDAEFLGAADHLLLNRFSVPVQWLIRFGVIAALVFVHALLARGFGYSLSWFRARRRLASRLLIVCWLVAGSWWARSLWHPVDPAHPSMLRVALTDALGRVLGGTDGGGTPFDELLASAIEERSTLPSRFEGLGGADVYVLFIESYGRVAWGSVGRAQMTEWCSALDTKLRERGFVSATGMVYPSIRGGQSSLAHAELQAGVKIANRGAMRRLLSSDLPALPKIFRQSGYRTYNVHPATTVDWPEGKFFGFENDIFQAQLPYEGTRYHWGRMPDQYALRLVLERDVKPDPRPVYLQFVSVTSHAPFSMIPPYLSDWSQAGDPAAFANPAKHYPIGWTNFATDPQVGEAYLESIYYSLRTMVGMALEADRPSLCLVLGDHQPPLRSSVLGIDSRFDVPLHVWTNQQDLLQPFLDAGFNAGLVPSDEATGFSMSRLATRLLQWFGPAR